jgi:hypothetical protein
MAVSRSEQRRLTEPVGRSAKHSLGRQRDCQQLFLGVGGRGQLEADGHAGAVPADRHRDCVRRLTRRWLSASATSDISGGVRHKVGDAMIMALDTRV